MSKPIVLGTKPTVFAPKPSVFVPKPNVLLAFSFIQAAISISGGGG